MPLVLYCKTQMGLIQECKSDVVIDDIALSFQSVLDEKTVKTSLIVCRTVCYVKARFRSHKQRMCK